MLHCELKRQHAKLGIRTGASTIFSKCDHVNFKTISQVLMRNFPQECKWNHLKNPQRRTLSKVLCHVHHALL